MHAAVDIFRALADPTRKAIFERLARKELSVKELTGSFEVSQPAISQHLAQLRLAGLVRERREGRSTYYRVDPGGLKPLIKWIDHYRAFWLEMLPELDALLKEMK